MDQSVWVKSLHSNGPSMLNVVVGNDSQENSNNDTQYMWELMQKKSHKLFRKRVPNPAEEKKLENDIGLQPVPPEIYRKNLTVTQRRSLFYQTLFRKDILYLRVVNIRNPYDYKLQVVAKHGNCMRLEDLQIIMYLPKIPEETKFFKGGLWEFEYIRGALCSCSLMERKLFVTLDPLIFEGAEAPKLGKVGVNDLPFSLWCPEIGMSIYGYLIKSRVFYKTHLETILRNVLGIEGNDHISLFQEWDRKKYPFEETPANFPKLFTCAKSSALLRRSIRLYIVGDIPKAFKYANKALSLDPDAVYTRVCRGVLNVLRGNLTAAFVDTQDSLKLDHKSELAKKQMSALLVVAAEKYFERRDFTKLYKTLLVAIGLNPSHFKGPAVLETFKVVRYIYRMTRDPQFSFPFAPTHQKILSRFFKNEGSLRRKFVLPPNYEDDHVSVPSRALPTRQMKQYQRSEERHAETDYHHHHRQSHNHRRKRSKSGSRRQRSRSRSSDLSRRHRPGSFISELNLLRDQINNANQDIICVDSTSTQRGSAVRLRNASCEGEQQQRGHGTQMSKRNKEIDGYTSNQQFNSGMQMNTYKNTEGRPNQKRRFRNQQRNSNLVICVDSTSELAKESRTKKSFENQNVSEDNTFNQPLYPGKQVKNINAVPIRSTHNQLGGSGTRKSNLNQGADSTLNQQSASGMGKSNSSQNASVQSMTNQQQGSGTNVNKANQGVPVHSESNQHSKAVNPQSNRNRCVNSILNRLLGAGMLKSNSSQSILIQSKLNQLCGSGTRMSNPNHTVDPSNQQHKSGMPKSGKNQFEPSNFRDINVQKSGTLMNISHQHVSDDFMNNEMSITQTDNNNTDRGVLMDSMSNQLHEPTTYMSNLNKDVSVDSGLNQQTKSQISNISTDQGVHQHATGVLESSENQIAPLYDMGNKKQCESGMYLSNLNKGDTFSSTSNHPNESGTLKSKETQSISINCTPNQQYICETLINNEEQSPHNSDTMKEHQLMDQRYLNRNTSFDSTDRSGSSKSYTDEHTIDLDINMGHQQSETIVSQSNYVCPLPNQQQGFGMLTSNRNQAISIYSTPVQQSGLETWMSNLNHGVTIDPKPKQQSRPAMSNNRVVPVFCTDIHKVIDPEVVKNISNKSSTDLTRKQLHDIGTLKTNKKRSVSSDSMRKHRRRSKVRERNHKRGISVDSLSNQRHRSRMPKSTGSRVVSITTPNQQRDSTKRHVSIDSISSQQSGPSSQMSNWTRQVSINSVPNQEHGCRRQVSNTNPEVVSVDYEPNEQHRSEKRISEENEDVICVSYTSDPQHKLETQNRNEDDDVICIDDKPYQKSGSESRNYKPDNRYGSVRCTCDQNKRHGSRCHKCDVSKRHRSGSPLYYRDRRRSRSPSYYLEKRRRSGSHSSDYRYKQHRSRSRSSIYDKKRKSRSRSPDKPSSRRTLEP